MPASKPVVALGECLVDLIAPKGVALTDATSLSIREGGAPANVAVALARLGVPSQMRTVLGDDPFGERLLATLKGEGVDTSHVRIAEGEPTTLALAWSDARGDGRFRLIRLADRLLSPDDCTKESLADVEALVVGSVAMCAEPSRTAVATACLHANELGVPVVADLNIRPGQVPMDELRMSATLLIISAALVKLSVDDARELWGSTSIEETADAMRRYDKGIVVITDGSRGAALVTDGELIQLPVLPVNAIEPTGAGDAFTAAFVSRMIDRGWHGADESDLRFAMAAGALATTRPGAMDGLPTREQLDAFIAAQA